MSTPTTATATIPHSHYHHSSHHFQYYDPYRSAANQLLPSSSRIAPSYPASTSSYAPSSATHTTSTTINGSSFYRNSSLARSHRQDITELPVLLEPNYTTMAPSKAAAQQVSSNNSQSARKRRRNTPVDWTKFYGGQPPKEIIVIDDTPEPDSNAVSAASASQTLGSGSTVYSYTNGNGVGGGVSANTSATRHAPKRRKRDDDAPVASGTRYDPVHHSRLNGSTATPRQNGILSDSTISSDRHDSAIHTTAATSLGSLSSNGQYDLDAQPGQKRKRTRQQVANEVKRRDNYPSYHPPPHPPKKAGDVHVRVVPDVSLAPFQLQSDYDPADQDSRRTRLVKLTTMTAITSSYLRPN